MKKHKLHKVAPTLSTISKESGFKVPHDYFDAVEDAVFSTIKEEEFEGEISKNTFKTPKKYFDTVEDLVITRLKAESIQNQKDSQMPADYFDTIEDKVMVQIKEPKKTITLNTFTKFIAPIAIAASLLLIFILNSTPKQVTFESLATSEIEQLIDEGIIDIDTDLVTATFTDVELQTEEFNSFISDNEALEYLSDEDLEILLYEN